MPNAADYFVSKRDRWLVLVLWGASALGAAAVVPALWVSRGEPLALAGATLSLLGVGIGPWVLYGTGYAFERDHLLIRGGPFRWRVPFSEVVRVEPSRNPASSPACSLERLLIQYGSREIMVSPLDRSGFLRRLAVVCPQLRQNGERLLAAG